MKHNRAFQSFHGSPQIAIFLCARSDSTIYPAVTKEKNIRSDSLAKNMYCKDSHSPELSIVNAETRAAVASIVSS